MRRKKRRNAVMPQTAAPMNISAIAATVFDRAPSDQNLMVADQWKPPVNLCDSSKKGKATRLAMDAALDAAGVYTAAQAMGGVVGVDGGSGISFPGYPALANLQQNPLMRLIVDTISDESTRKWVTLQGVDKKVKDDDIKRVTDACEKWQLRDVFKAASEMVGFQGGCLLFIDVGATDEELVTPLVISDKTIGKGKLKALTIVEPMQVYPGLYDASNPLSPKYFRPDTWIVQGVEVHVSRFLCFTNNIPSLMLKPAYNFFGIPLVQLALRYVQNFESSRDASAEIVHNYSLLGLKTNLSQILTDEGRAQIQRRAKMMLGAKRTLGMAIIDKTSEEMFQIDTPMSGLKDLVGQQLELLALISGIPVTKLFGTAPQGMNATGEGDMRNFYDKIRTWQEILYFKNFQKARELIELTEFGSITPGITEVWEPLKESDPTEQANIRKTNADADAIYLDRGVLLPEEVRERLSADEESGFTGLDELAPLEEELIDGLETEATEPASIVPEPQA
jgi:phage-related protein (TIGR01555 family)